jgi:hypothetical protein
MAAKKGRRTRRYPEAYVALGKAVSRAIDITPGRDQAGAGRAIGMSQSRISGLVNNNHPGSQTLQGIELDGLVALRAYLGQTIDEILELPPLVDAATAELLEEAARAQASRTGDMPKKAPKKLAR